MFVRSPISVKLESGPSSSGSRPLKRVPARRSRNLSRRYPLDRGRDLPDVLRRRAAAAADDVDEAVPRELTEEAARVLRPLVVQAELVRQARVRIAGHPRRRDLREVLDERAHLRRPERAVDADHERARVLDRDPERLDRLAREVAAALVDGGEREPERQLGRDVLRGGDRRLRVQRVEDRLDQEQVHPALAQGADLVRVRLGDLVEGRGAVGGVVDLRRQRQRDVERPDGAGDEARTAVLRRPLVRGGTCEPRAREVHLLHDVGPEAVVRLADRRRRERVRRGDVGAGREVLAVDARDQLRLRQVEQVRIARHVVAVIAEPLAAVALLPAHLALQEHAPRAVEDGDALPEDRFEPFACVLHLRSLQQARERVLSGALGVC